MGFWGDPQGVKMRQTTLTAKSSWSSAGVAEQWGTEEAVCAQADCPNATVDVYATLSGYMDSGSSGLNCAVWLQLSTDGGSNWTDGAIVNTRATAGAATDRDSLHCFCMLRGAAVTGDVMARAMGSVTTNTTGRTLNLGSIKMIVKAAS